MSSSTLKRVKLSFKDDRIVLPVTDQSGTVSSLLTAATNRFRLQRLLANDDSFISVRTIDGYTICNTDNIKDVIEQNDSLVLVNKAAWIAEFKSKENPKYWFGLRSYDYITEAQRNIAIQYASSRNAICISLSGDSPQLQVFDRESLTSYAKDGDILVATETGERDGAKHELSAHFVIKNGQVCTIRLAAKALSDPQAQISEWPIIIKENEITYGEEKKIQGTWPAAPSKEFTLPASTRTGSLLQPETPPPTRNYLSEPNISSGESPLVYSQLCPVFCEQYRDSTKNHQHLRVEFSVTNNSELDTHLSRFLVEYELPDGTWATFTDLGRGYKQSEWSWSFREGADDPMLVPARGVGKFAVNARLELPGFSHLETRPRSLAMALPVPLKLRYTFVDQDGKKAHLSTSVEKRGVDLPTLESLCKDKPVQKYIYVDDLTSGERFGAVYVLGDNNNYVRISPDSSYYNLDSASLHTYTYKALQDKTPEAKICEYNCGTFKGSVHLLVSLEDQYAYGVRVRLSTANGSIDESFALPKELW